VLNTCRGAKTPCGGGPLCYSKFGAWRLVLATLVAAIAACPAVARVTDFTWFTHGHTTLRLYGFFAMTMFAAIYHILPRVSGVEISARAGSKLHFWLAMPGALLLALPMIGAGIKQGLKLADANVPFLDTTKASDDGIPHGHARGNLDCLGAV
jgi:cytochrome c oxidase cbb3-type subunit 1